MHGIQLKNTNSCAAWNNNLISLFILNSHQEKNNEANSSYNKFKICLHIVKHLTFHKPLSSSSRERERGSTHPKSYLPERCDLLISPGEFLYNRESVTYLKSVYSTKKVVNNEIVNDNIVSCSRGGHKNSCDSEKERERESQRGPRGASVGHLRETRFTSQALL